MLKKQKHNTRTLQQFTQIIKMKRIDKSKVKKYKAWEGSTSAFIVENVSLK